ncbi:CBS domain containing-hemolysin-like protein [Mycobacterium frederiksbergense]|uniref:CBS domain containing-hemolysin-like protein n=1 Tax=Mycolicibacterium frederiksbergense TaxID=117567 RepID=A0ABT6KUD9_9MYCO|nr:hemolysin family protein [Mycolicibacterium frederiksbergense]MDH6194319.1 CBS domain containing-hemolysin-like protein [Mycolicibacterium frederiksbergense]
MGDILSVLLTVLLLAANAFFVASEFALISARRDRLQALAEQGKRSAVTVIRAGEHLSLMLAGSQLGITICSILLGRVGEPAVAHLLEAPFALIGVSDAVLHTVSFFVALAIVVTLHVLLGEMVPKNIAIAGPETAAMLLIPPYLLYIRAARPFISFYNWCANATLRAFRVETRDELESAVSTVELSEMIAESVSEGLLDTEEHGRLTRALETRSRTVSDVAMPLSAIHAIPVAAEGCGPTVGAVERALTETGYSRFPVTDASGTAIGYLHIKDVLPQINDPDAVLDVTMVRPLPRLPASLPLPDALSRMRRSKSHLALVVDERSREEHVPDECGPDECMPDESVREAHVLDDAAPGDNSDAAPAPNGTVTAMVALEDMVEDLVGTVRDGTHRV